MVNILRQAGRYKKNLLGVLCLAIIALIGLIVTLIAMIPRLTNISVLDQNGLLLSNRFPVAIPTASPGTYLIKGDLEVNKLTPTLLSIIPDDCLEKISIDGTELSKDLFFGQRCNAADGALVNLNQYLQPGKHTFEATVSDSNGEVSLNFRPSLSDKKYAMLLFTTIALSIFILGYILIYLCKFISLEGFIISLILLILALILRIYLLPYKSGDYTIFLSRWYDYFVVNGRLRSFSHSSFSDYAPLYLYFISFFTFIPLGKLFLFKAFSIIFDVVISITMALLVHRKYNKEYIDIIAFGLTLFLPTVFTNSAVWAQSDVIYTTFLLSTVLLLCKGKNTWAMISFGIAFSFKLQAIFLSPLLLILLWKKNISIWNILLIPLTFFLSLVPSILLGKPLLEAILVYQNQTNTYSQLTLNAPSIYQWVTFNNSGYAYFITNELFTRAGIILTMALVLILSYSIVKIKKSLTNTDIITISFIFVLLVPFFLPRMHERYFFAADIFSIAYAFYNRRMFFVPIVVQIASLLAYFPFLFKFTLPFSFAYLSLSLLIVLGIVMYDFFTTESFE